MPAVNRSKADLMDLIVELNIDDPSTNADPYGSFAELSQPSSKHQENYEEYSNAEWSDASEISEAVYSEPVYYNDDRHHLSPLSQNYQQEPEEQPLRKRMSREDLLDIEAEFVEQPNMPIYHQQTQQLSPLLPNLQHSPSNSILAHRFLSKYGSGMLASSGSQVTMMGSAGSCCDELGSIDFRSQDSLKRVSFSPELQTLHDPACHDLLTLREQQDGKDGQLYLNYRNCMRNTHTCLPLSFQELKGKIEEHGMDITFKEERRTSDQKSLFLLPLNGLSQPRWIPPNSNLRVGRTSNWLQSQSRVVSRNHCEILHDIQQYYIKDVGSKSGTFVNGTRIGVADAISPPRELHHGDVIQIGTDLGSEADAYGRVPDNFRSVQLMVLYGYKARLSVPLKDEIMYDTPIPIPANH